MTELWKDPACLMDNLNISMPNFMFNGVINYKWPFSIIVILTYSESIDWFKGKITGKSHISRENLWFPADLPLSQPIDRGISDIFWGMSCESPGLLYCAASTALYPDAPCQSWVVQRNICRNML